MGRAIVLAGLAVLFGGIAWYCFGQAARFDAIPIRSAAALADAAPGTAVLVYGGVGAEAGAQLAIYVTETEHCRTTTRTDSKGKVSSSTSCSWDETGRSTPPFPLILSDDASPLFVLNADYRLTGNNRFVSTGWSTRWRGFQRGDGVLVVGTATERGILAYEVYGGTRDQYVGGWRVWA